MSEAEQEKELLRSIKYLPMIIAFSFFYIMSFMVIYSYIQQSKNEIKELRHAYLDAKKARLKNQILLLTEHIKYEKKYAEKKLKERLKSRVEEAYDISMNIYNQNRNKNKELIIKQIKEALRPIRFNEGKGYFFIFDSNLKNVLFPLEPEMEGKDFSGYFDVKGNYLARSVAKTCLEKSGGFFTWYWKKPQDKLSSYKKLGFVKYFKPLNWFIGTSGHLFDFEKNVQDKLVKEIKTTNYGKNHYIWLYTKDGGSLIDINRSSILKEQAHLKDVNQTLFIKKIVEMAKNGDGFLNVLPGLNRNNTDKSMNDISYVAYINAWGWVIGLGDHLQEMKMTIHAKEEYLQSQLNKTIIKLSIVFSVMAILLAILLAFLSKKSQKLCEVYKNLILSESEKSKKQLLLIQQQNKLASMGEMLGNISHQWKQPLNSLSLSVSKLTLLKENDKLTDEIMLSSFERMEKSIIYLSKTIDVFRNFFIPAENDEKFNLKDEIDNTVFIVQDSFANNFIKISSFCEKDIIIKGDKKKLEQVLINILNNAKDAILTNKISKAKVKISAKKSDGYIKITIQDNAQGIPEEIKDQVFEPYFTTKFKSQGTGVGLYMSKMIIENNFNGTLIFENKYNGVEFTITIPYCFV